MSIVEAIAATINVVGLVFLGAQVMLARKTITEAGKAQEREWGRQRKKSTLDMLVATSQYRESLKAVLPWNDRDPKEVAAFLEKADGDHEKLAPVRRYLNHLEVMAVGVNQGVFDLETIDMSNGDRIVDTVANYRTYIDNVRREINRPAIYIEIEGLALRLQSIHQASAAVSVEAAHDGLIAARSRVTPKPAIKRIRSALGRYRPGSAVAGLGSTEAGDSARHESNTPTKAS